MKFCPICKKDYNDDEPLCPSCGGTLLNGSYSDSVVLFESEHEEIILKLFNFLRENNFSSVQYYSDSTSGSFYLTCSAAEEEDCAHSLSDFASDNPGHTLSDAEQTHLEESVSSMLQDFLPDDNASTFVHAADKYSDMMSSASSLLIVGILGFVFIVLVYFKIIPLDMSILFYIFSSIMFAAFIIAGIVSFFKAGKIKSTISSENQLLTRIKDYLRNDYQPVVIDSSVSEEESYYIRTDDMKARIASVFPEADALLTDSVIEEVYSELYPSETES